MPREPFEHLLSRSSLGRSGVRRLAARTPPHVVETIREGVRSGDVRRGRDLFGGSAPTPTSVDQTTTKAENGAPRAGPKENDMATRKTSSKAAAAASKVLRDGRTGKASKTAAGSALSQRAPKKGKS